VIRVLLVDDQALVRDGFRMILELDDEIEVVGEAEDGKSALAAVAKLRPDLVLMDIRMPGLDGLETARRIRAIEAEQGARPLHLVALTANAGRDDERAARAAGFDAFLAKPLNLRALPGLLERRVAAA
jgi:CheY-like chemotaxis protein